LDRIPGRLFLGNLIERRALIWQLVRRDFNQRYVGSSAGWVWGLIHPAVLLLSWTFVFQICLGMDKLVTARGEITQNYTLYLLAGYLPWFLFQETFLRSTNSLVEQANLITKTVFPSEIIPIAIFLSSLIGHLLTLSLVIAAIVLVLGHIPVQALVLPAYMLLAGMFAVGLGWITSSLQVYIRDTAQVTNVLVTLWFWLTPIFVLEEQYPENLRFLIRWNPLALLVRAYRETLLTAGMPDAGDLAQIALLCAATFVAGGLFFRQLKRGFADVL
jgi:ABC-type polysaccharide/polyol phosphate export permease